MSSGSLQNIDFSKNKYCVGFEEGPNGNSIILIVVLVISIIGIIITAFITYHSSINMSKMSKLDNTIKSLCIAVLTVSFLIFIIAFIKSILCIDMFVYYPSMVLSAFFTLLYCLLFCLILATLLYRLYSTFIESAFKLSGFNQFLLSLMFILTIICVILYNIQHFWVTFAYNGNWNAANRADFKMTWMHYFGVISLIIYTVTSGYALFLFLHKLMKLAKLHRVKVQSMTNIQLNKAQMDMINTATKYGMLLSISIVTAILASIGWSIGNLIWDSEIDCCWDESNAFLNHMMILITIIDALVHVICLYLQFPFSKRYYDKYCRKWLEFICCCRKILVMDVKRTIQGEHLKVNSNDSECEESIA